MTLKGVVRTLLGRLLTIVLKWVPRVMDAFNIVDGHLAVRPTSSSRRGLVRPVRFKGPPSTVNWSRGRDVLFTAGRPTTMSQIDRLLLGYEAFHPGGASVQRHIILEATETHTITDSPV